MIDPVQACQKVRRGGQGCGCYAAPPKKIICPLMRPSCEPKEGHEPTSFLGRGSASKGVPSAGLTEIEEC